MIDAKTEETVTNIVLLQIINEEESGKFPLFTTEILQNMIRFYGNPLQKMLSDFLEKSFTSFNQNQSFDYFSEVAKRNMEIFQNFSETYFKQKNKKEQK